ncbi:SPJ_0845 family protein [Lacticaseibacillus daqingensis]|uniref:SPJ_0845 family protein n=1 Tax=Lacticaseibacillus daqingensis TaxID=2486014 RepID=UPI0013DDAF89|nr:SPJ_0845 family protein [Lacticaseibacillus daqingensis]
MALKVNTKNDWGEMFDKFATMPEVEKKAAGGPDPKKQPDQAKPAAQPAKKD